MANIGNLIVNVVARTGAFEAGMTRSRKQLKLFEQSARATQRTAKMLTSALGLVGAAVSAKAFVSSMKSTADAIDDVNMAAQKLKVPIDKLQALRLATELDNVGPEETDKALIRLSRTVSEAADGNKGAIKTFQQLGLDINELRRLDATQQFVRLADGLKNVKNQGDKVRLVIEALGKSGANLLPTLAQGADGLRSIEDQARSLGITVSQQAATAIDTLQDQLTLLGKGWEGVKTGILIDITPVAIDAVESLQETIAGARALRDPTKKGDKLPKAGGGQAAKLWDILTGQDPLQKRITDWMIGNQLRRGDVSGTAAPTLKELGPRGVASLMAREPGFDPNKVQTARDNASIALNDRTNVFGMIGKKLTAAGQSIASSAQSYADWMKKADEAAEKWAKANRFKGWQSVFSAWWGAPALAQKLAEQRKKAEGKNAKGSLTPAENKALIKGTLEAYVAQRANMLPKQALEEAKKQTALLAKIERKTGGGSGSSVTLTAVGIT